MKVIAIVKYTFAAIGLLMLIGAGLWYQHTRSFIESATRAEGTVTELLRSSSGTARPVVQFHDSRGQIIEFTSSTGSNPPRYSVGERVTVFYRASDPNDALIDGSLWVGHLIFGGLGTVFFLIGGGIIVGGVVKGRRDEQLRATGLPIQTDFQSVDLNTSLSANGQHPFRVTTQWQNPATGEVHVFRSNNLWFDPTQYITAKQITVYIAPNNPRKYYMDVSFLPRLAG